MPSAAGAWCLRNPLPSGGQPCSHRSFCHLALSPVPTGTHWWVTASQALPSLGIHRAPGIWWLGMAATCLLVLFCPVAAAWLVLLPHTAPSLVLGSCPSTGELPLPGDHPAWLFLPLLKALPRPSVTQGSHHLRIRPSCSPWQLWSLHHHTEASRSAGAWGGYCTTSRRRTLLAFRKVPIAEVAFEEVPGQAKTPWQASTAPAGPQAGLPPSAEPRDRVLVISSP